MSDTEYGIWPFCLCPYESWWLSTEALAPVMFSVESGVLLLSELGSWEGSWVWIKTEEPIGTPGLHNWPECVSHQPCPESCSAYGRCCIHWHGATHTWPGVQRLVEEPWSVLGELWVQVLPYTHRPDHQASQCSLAATACLLQSKENVATGSLPEDLVVASLTLTRKYTGEVVLKNTVPV